MTIDNVVQYDAAGEVVQTMDFNDLDAAPAYEARLNKTEAVNNAAAALTLEQLPASEEVAGFEPGKASKLTALGVYVDSTSPVTDKAVYTVRVNPSAAQYGLVFNYADASNYAAIEYDGAKWVAGGKVAGQDVAPIDLSAAGIPAPVPGTASTLRLDCSSADGYSLTVTDDSGEKTFPLGKLEGICTQKGQVGLLVGEGVTLYAGALSVEFPVEAAEIPDPTEHFITLRSDEMSVLVGDSFPHIYTYKTADGQTSLAYGVYPGQENTGMVVYTAIGSNGKLDAKSAVNCTTTSQKTSSNETDSAVYTITASGEGVQATFTVKLTVEGKTLRMDVTGVDVAENSAPVRAFAFADAPLVTMYGLGAGAAMTRANGWGPVSDIFVENKGAAADQTVNNITYALLYDEASGSVAAVEDNPQNGANK